MKRVVNGELMMQSEQILALLSGYVSANRQLFEQLSLDPREACTRLMWDVPIDPDQTNLPQLIDQVCRNA